jgi:hypothetical protein
MDGDGFDSASYGGEDCDDGDETVYPGAPDIPYDGIVNDCDTSDEFDADGDGHNAVAHGGDDCDDANSGIHPEAEEIWYDGVDQDCEPIDTGDTAPAEDTASPGGSGGLSYKGGGGCTGCGGGHGGAALLPYLFGFMAVRRRAWPKRR